MKIIELIQGTPEWLAHRAQHLNASDAPAMMGCSLYETRSQLLHRLATGIAPEVDAGTQRRFDEGHRIEALARVLAEKIVEEDLYPVTGAEGRYSASFDGLTLDDSVAFEHKTLNDALRTAMMRGCTGADLPMQYRVQMEHQCMVSGCEKVLFMASKWDGDVLLEERNCWYTPDLALRSQIFAGWQQFESDLAAYQPDKNSAPAPTGKAPESLPALHIEVTGMVTASNLEAYKQHALAVFNGINRELETDSDFADAEKTIKWCGDVENRLKSAKEHALSQTASIDQLFKAIDDIGAEARRVRLDLDKLVKARKEAVKAEIVARGVAALRTHIHGIDTRLGKPYMPDVPADFAGVVKNKRTIESLQDAVATELARAKIAATEVGDRIDLNLQFLRNNAADHLALFPDTATIVLKAADDLQMLTKARIAEHLAVETKRLEAERERIRDEERAKAVEYTLATAPPNHQTQVHKFQGQDEFDHWRQGGDVVANVVPLRTAAPPADTGARIKLGEINALLAPIALTADGLASLGFAHVATDKAAKLAAHESVLAWIAIADAQAPDGIPGEMLAEALTPLNERLTQSAADAEWAEVTVTRDMQVLAGGRPYALLSESEKWRADAMLAAAISHLSKTKLLVLDRFDVLDLKGREDLIAWLDILAQNGEVDTALIFGTLKALPAALPATMAAHWLESGVVAKLRGAA